MENAASLTEGSEIHGTQLVAPPAPVAPLPSLAPDVAAGPRGGVSARAAWKLLLVDLSVVGLLCLTWGGIAAAGGTEIGTGWFILLGAITLAAFGAFGLYATSYRPDPSVRDEGQRMGLALIVAVFAWMLLSAAVSAQALDRAGALSAIGWMLSVAVVSLSLRRVVRRRTFAARPERVLIIGAGTIGQSVARRFAEDGRATMRVVGFVDDEPLPLAADLEGLPVFEDHADLADIIEITGTTRIIVAFSKRSSDDVLEALRNSRFSALPISVVPRYFDITPSHATLSEIGGMPLVDIHSARLSRGAALTKRILDVTLASFGVIVLSPVFLTIAVLVKATSKGPVFFGQLRTGHNGKTFRMWKFRTMVKDAEASRHDIAHLNDMVESGPLFKVRDDPRVTTVGRVLRRLSLDELPQLFNVLNGSMSLVGPRPFVCHEADQMQGWSRRRLDLVPGITGLWQVSGRNDVPYEEMIRLDYMYVANWSVWWDLRILLETIPRVLTGRGAS